MKICLLRENGQSLVEIALLLPLVFFLILATVDIGMGFRTYIVLNNGARESVRWISTRPQDVPGARARGATEAQRIGLSLGEDGVTIEISPNPPYAAGDEVTVTLEHDYTLMFGAFTQLPNLPIRTSATMVVMYDD